MEKQVRMMEDYGFSEREFYGVKVKREKVRAFCADVLSDEPPRADNPLLSCVNAFITPHIAWATKEARTRLVSIAIGNVQAFLSAHPINVV